MAFGSALIGALAGSASSYRFERWLQNRRWDKEKSGSLYIPLYHCLKERALNQVLRFSRTAIEEWDNIRQRGEHYKFSGNLSGEMIKLANKISEYNGKVRKYGKNSQKEVEKFFEEKLNLSRATKVKTGNGRIADLYRIPQFRDLIGSTRRYLPHIERSDQIKLLENYLDDIKNLPVTEGKTKTDITLGELFKKELNIDVQNAEEFYDLIFEKIIKPMEEYSALIQIQEEVKVLIENVLKLIVEEEPANQLPES